MDGRRRVPHFTSSCSSMRVMTHRTWRTRTRNLSLASAATADVTRCIRPLIDNGDPINEIIIVLTVSHGLVTVLETLKNVLRTSE